MEAAVVDFGLVESWSSPRQKEQRRLELNSSIARANDMLIKVRG